MAAEEAGYWMEFWRAGGRITKDKLNCIQNIDLLCHQSGKRPPRGDSSNVSIELS